MNLTSRDYFAKDSASGPKCKRRILTARVIVNEPICKKHYRLTLKADSFPASKPGQFINILCSTSESSYPRVIEEADEGQLIMDKADVLAAPALLRRPFSLAGRRKDNGGTQTVLEIIYRILGSGTRWLSQLGEGEQVNIIGPLGNGFRTDFLQPETLAILIGGGTGIAPLTYLASELMQKGQRIKFFVGAASKDILPISKAILEDKQFPIIIATEDGSAGFKGTVLQAWEDWLGRQSLSPSGIVVYTCGPEVMMREVAQRCISMGVRCQVSLERIMACGMGICQGCAVKVRMETPPYW
ncbi:MAG: hypothetical protein DRN29_08105, partial [Thermoplasmata archaeon]